MKFIRMKYCCPPLYIIVLSYSFYFCARISSPKGGIEDKTPPKVLSYSIDNQSINVDTDVKEIKINFDEYLRLKDAANQIVISPPMEKLPTFSPLGTPQKYVTIKFNEKLRKNTTYTINFGESIEDNNEGNKLTNFTYVFSTGKTIDSISYSGQIIDNKSLEYDKKVLVGLYKIDSAFNDSTFIKQKPYYVTRPDSLGKFTFRYLHDGNYFLMGLSDTNRNLKYNPAVDKLAFDKDTLSLPSKENGKLRLFREKEKFAVKIPAYDSWGKIIFQFLGNPDSVSVQNRDESYEKGMQIPSETKDSLIYWFKPLAKDTLKTSRKDTLSFFIFHNGKQIDTLTLNKKIRFRPQKKLQLNQIQSANDFAPLTLFSETPLVAINKDSIQVLRDSTAIDFKMIQKKEKPYSFQIDNKKKFDNKYQIQLLPGAIKDFFGQTNDSLSYLMQTKKEQDYASLQIRLIHSPKTHFWFRLLQNKVVKRAQYTRDSIINFKYLNPGNYTMQLIVDKNENGIWDTGNYKQKIQPEPCFFYEEEILLNAYWEVKKTWDLLKNPIVRKKPKKDKKEKTSEKNR